MYEEIDGSEWICRMDSSTYECELSELICRMFWLEYFRRNAEMETVKLF